jgi:hypothetical protein
MSTPHKLNITQGAAKYLQDLLNVLGWAKTTNDIIIGGSLLSTKLELTTFPEATAEETVRAYEARVLPWMNTKMDLELTDKERDCVRRCLEHCSKEARIRVSKYSSELLTVFGYTE